jgi:hypothetical protein
MQKERRLDPYGRVVAVMQHDMMLRPTADCQEIARAIMHTPLAIVQAFRSDSWTRAKHRQIWRDQILPETQWPEYQTTPFPRTLCTQGNGHSIARAMQNLPVTSQTSRRKGSIARPTSPAAFEKMATGPFQVLNKCNRYKRAAWDRRLPAKIPKSKER